MKIVDGVTTVEMVPPWLVTSEISVRVLPLGVVFVVEMSVSTPPCEVVMLSWSMIEPLASVNVSSLYVKCPPCEVVSEITVALPPWGVT